jgi:hypothetical protein
MIDAVKLCHVKTRQRLSNRLKRRKRVARQTNRRGHSRQRRSHPVAPRPLAIMRVDHKRSGSSDQTRTCGRTREEDVQTLDGFQI